MNPTTKTIISPSDHTAVWLNHSYLIRIYLNLNSYWYINHIGYQSYQFIHSLSPSYNPPHNQTFYKSLSLPKYVFLKKTIWNYSHSSSIRVYYRPWQACITYGSRTNVSSQLSIRMLNSLHLPLSPISKLSFNINQHNIVYIVFDNANSRVRVNTLVYYHLWLSIP